MSLQACVDAAFAPSQEAIAQGRVPGAVLAAVTRTGARAIRVAGSAQLEPTQEPIRAGTIFDLASLTKVIFTTTEILKLAEQGVLALDDPLTRLIPDFRQYDAACWERRLTFRACLGHQTPLPHVEPIYTYGLTPETARAFVLQREWRSGPPVYSDINFILLGIALERFHGTSLGDMALPKGFTWRPKPEDCAATERCSWRGRVMRGEVHDENAFALGGASGHAGLFGDAEAVMGFAEAMLRGEILREETIHAMLAPESATRLIGWERPHEGWHGGALWSSRACGHTGFTGVALYLDFERGVALTLLTNRVHPSRHTDSGIQPLRRASCDAFLSCFDGSAT